jgi:hypothetical protein
MELAVDEEAVTAQVQVWAWASQLVQQSRVIALVVARLRARENR